MKTDENCFSPVLMMGCFLFSRTTFPPQDSLALKQQRGLQNLRIWWWEEHGKPWKNHGKIGKNTRSQKPSETAKIHSVTPTRSASAGSIPRCREGASSRIGWAQKWGTKWPKTLVMFSANHAVLGNWHPNVEGYYVQGALICPVAPVAVTVWKDTRNWNRTSWKSAPFSRRILTGKPENPSPKCLPQLRRLRRNSWTSRC